MDSLHYICAFFCVEVFAMATAGENKQPRVKMIADPTISVSDLEKSIEAFMKSIKKRKLGKVLTRAMGGHSGKHPCET